MLREFSGLLVSMARGKTRKQHGRGFFSRPRPSTGSLTLRAPRQPGQRPLSAPNYRTKNTRITENNPMIKERNPSKSAPPTVYVSSYDTQNPLSVETYSKIMPSHATIKPLKVQTGSVSSAEDYLTKHTAGLTKGIEALSIEETELVKPPTGHTLDLKIPVKTEIINRWGQNQASPPVEGRTINNRGRVGFAASAPRKPSRGGNNTRRQNRRGLGSGFKVSWTRHACRRMPKTAKDKAAYKKWLAGRSIGFTERSHLKALGVIPRANGTCKVSPKYR